MNAFSAIFLLNPKKLKAGPLFILLLIGCSCLQAQTDSSLKKGLSDTTAQSQQLVNPLIACGLSGLASVTRGTSSTYTLSHCSATNWTINCGTITSSNAANATVMFDGAGCSSATLTALDGPTILATKVISISFTALVPGSVSPASVSITSGASPGLLSLQGVSGGSGLYTYQWQSSPDGSSWTNVSGATGTTYTPGSLSSTTYYRVLVTSNGSSQGSGAATISVYPAVVGGSISPAAPNINYNTSPGALTLSGVSGGNGTYTYQWQSSPTGAGGSWTNITGATSTTYTPGNLTTTIWYQVVVTSNIGSAASSSSAVTVYPQIAGGSITPAASNINYNTSPGTLTLSGVSGGSGTYAYQWQSSTDGTNYTDVSGATATTYTPGNLTATTWYHVVVTSNGATGNSAYSEVTVYPLLVGGSVNPGAPNINYNTSPGTLTLSGVTGGNGTYTYQWQSSTDGSNFTDIGGATGTTYASGILTVTTWYHVVVTSNGIPVNSNISEVTVYPQLIAGSISPGGGTFGYNVAIGTLTLSGVTGGTGTYTYQWQNSPDGSNWTNIGGATSSTYAAGNLTATTYYQVVVTSNGVTVYSGSALFSINTADDLNYIRVRGIQKPGVTDPATANNLVANTDVQQTTQYFDGLGRVMQTVSKKSTPAGQDAVGMTVYDAFGREATKYLPYVSTINDGFYKLTATADQNSFNTTQFSGESNFYGQTNFEPSPLNRVQATYAPGSSWVGASRGVTQTYLVNAASDSVRIWTIAATAGSIPTTTAMYAAGTLYKNQTTDEQGQAVVEYKDLLGRVVLKKVQLDPSPGTAHIGWLCTYYVYDDLDNLRFVIQPRAIDLVMLNGTWNLSSITNLTDELCFRYEYDPRNRMIVKKVPGAGEVWMVYDARDRVVMAQDTNLRAQGKWMLTRYDSENRRDSSGLLTDSHDRSYHQNLGYGALNYPSTASGFELLNRTYYDNYDWASSQGLAASLISSYTSTGTYFNTSYNSSPVYAQPVTQFAISRGLTTGSATKVIGTSSQFLTAASFYDDRGRMLQTQSINQTGGSDTLTNQYDFSGRVIRSLLGQQKSGTNAQSHIVLTKMNYDAGGRLQTLYKNIDNAPSDQLIATNTYNELGQLQNKQLGNSLDNLAYAYNIRGWLSSINKDFLAGTPGNYFGMELGYDKSTSAAGATYTGLQYNGNIGGTVWKTAGDGIGRKYDFTYDNVNRLLSATFTQNEGSGFVTSSTMNFNVSNLTYDGNGNILSMNQMGFKVGGSSTIDQLSYTYQPNSNKLAKVTDAVSDATTKLGDFHDGTNGSSDDYAYDGNGNLTLDNNKSISSIIYNYLNLPQVVTVTSKGTITYTYDAGGNKLQKTTVDNTVNPSKTTTTLYLDGFVYQQDTLQFIGTEEGRARWAYHKYTNGTSAYGFEYDFFEKDHLGNTRVLLTEQKDTAKYLASGESAYRATESQLFTNLVETATARATAEGYPTDLTITNPNDTVFRVSGTAGDHKMGPSLLLKVMSGDKIDIAVQEYYNSGVTSTPNSSLTDVLASLATGVVNMTGGEKGTLTELNNPSAGPILDALNSFMNDNEPAPPSKPKAYLNWILLDEQLKYVSSYPQSGAAAVGASGAINCIGYTGIPITKSGFLYIWVSNETPNWNVYFDNLRVAHYTGPMLEETHYYPFGLTMAGISDKAIKTQYAQNKYRYNGKELQNQEFSDGSGLEQYDYGARFQDPQLGRWSIIDPKCENGRRWSPYAYGFDNPEKFIDPDGMWPGWGDLLNSAANYLINKAKAAAERAVQGVVNDVKQKAAEVVNGITLYASADATVTTGNRVAVDVKKVGGGDANIKSQELVSVKGEVNKTGSHAGYDHDGKDNKTTTSSGGAVDYGVGVSHTEKTTTQTQANGQGEVVGTSSETTIGATIYGPVSANVSHSKETEKDENGHMTTTQTTKGYVGVGWTVGWNWVLDVSLQAGVKIQTKKTD